MVARETLSASLTSPIFSRGSSVPADCLTVCMSQSVANDREWAANLYGELVGRAPEEDLAGALRHVERLGQLCAVLELPSLPADRRQTFQEIRAAFRAERLEPEARLVLVAVQAALAPLEGQRLSGGHRTAERAPVPGSAWRQITRARRQAIRCLTAKRSLAFAKRCQLEVAARPLAICDECGLVFSDSTSTRGPAPFRSCCDACSPKSVARRVADGERRARMYARNLDEIAPGMWN